MSSDVALSLTVVPDVLCVSVIQSQDDWEVTYTSTEVCAVKGSTVKIQCSYTYPSRIQDRDIKNRFWFKEKDGEPVNLRTDSKYSGRVQYRCYEKKCTLIIRDLRESDSAEYKFRFTTNQPDEKYTGSPGVTLSVTGLQVEVSRYDSTRSVLKCLSSCVLPRYPSYYWYKNGHYINTGSSHFVIFGSSDSYSCAVSGYEDQRSPSVSNYIWYKEDGNPDPPPLSGEPQLVFSSIQSSDSGQYYCRAENLLGRKRSECISIDVKLTNLISVNTSPPDGPKLPSVSVSPSAEIVEGSSVTLTCSSDANPAANYTWYKEDEDSPKASGQIFIITDFRAEHSGNYSCEAQNMRGRSNSSSYLIAASVLDKTTMIIRNTRLTLVVVIPMSLLLFCLWMRKKKALSSTTEPHEPIETVEYKCSEKNCTLRITNLRESDSAEYKFRFMTNQRNEKYTGSPGVTLSVTDPGLQLEVSRYDSTRSELKCLSRCVLPHRPSYFWYKNGHYFTTGSSSLFVYFGSSESYSCASCEVVACTANSTSPMAVGLNAPKLPSVSVSPSAEIVEGSSVTLTCSSDANPAANYIWYKEDVNPDPPPLSGEPQLVFSSIQSSDSGQYYCRAENLLGTKRSESISIDVKYAPKLPSVSVSPSAEIVEGSSVTLTCSSDANPAANYTWYKEDEDSLKASGQIFNITDFRAEHSGNYSCEAQNMRGCSNSTLHLVAVSVSPVSLTTVAVGSTTAIFLAIIILAAFLFIRKKRSSTQTNQSGDGPDNSAQNTWL
ncbi:B-cell receptor CD22-like [Anarhichas minor]|uniref:B-cell receptor CD22-like n=1 Tax=Anarhichas minor TaxID=65739 RepID=UPI003F73A65A